MPPKRKAPLSPISKGLNYELSPSLTYNPYRIKKLRQDKPDHLGRDHRTNKRSLDLLPLDRRRRRRRRSE